MTFEWDSMPFYTTQRDSSVLWARPRDVTYFPLTVKNQIGCTTRDSLLVTVVPWPVVDFEEDYEICFGAGTQVDPELEFFPGVGYSYSWIPGSGGKLSDISDPTLSNPVISPEEEGKTRYTLVVTNGICESEAVVQIDVEDEILIEYIYEDLGEFLKIPKTVAFENTTFAPFKYDFLWLVTNLETGVVDSFDTEHLEYEFGEPDLFDVSLYAFDPRLNCVEVFTDEFQFEQVVRPNLITPNGDGLNDYFIIEAPSSQVWVIRIYNRWGGLVYESENYANNWDGESNPAGVYYYEISSEDSEENYKGYLEVVR